MRNRKAQQSGNQAALVIGLVTLILIGYILFLPPEEREELLEGGNGLYEGPSRDDGNISIINVTSLRLEYVGEDEYLHNIPNLYLFETTGAEVLEDFTPFYIRNGWFDKKTYNVSFHISDLANTGNIALSFKAPEAKGRLLIALNGAQIFDYEVTQLNVGPIELKKELLKDGENTIYFSLSGVGIKFWTTNEYSIEGMKVTADITDISRQESLNIFTITNEEYYNIESAFIEFYPVCDSDKVGRLDVLLNKKPVFSSTPDCDLLNRQDIYPRDLNAGKNTVIFRTEKGSYRIEMIKVKTELKDVKTFLEYFEINSSLYDEIDDNDRDVWLEIEFVDDDEEKEAEVNINGHLTYLDQREPVYRKKITYWVDEGARNYVEITPKTVLKIRELRITSDEK